MFLNPVLNEQVDYPGDTSFLTFRGADGVRVEYFRKTSLDWVPVSNQQLEPAELNGDGACLLTCPAGRIRFVGGALASVSLEFGDSIPKLGTMSVIGSVNPIENELVSPSESQPTVTSSIDSTGIDSAVIDTITKTETPTIDPVAEPVTQPEAEDLPAAVVSEPIAEPEVQPAETATATDEASPEQITEPIVEPTAEPIAEPVAEQTVAEAIAPEEPVADPATDTTSEVADSLRYSIAIDGVDTASDLAPWLEWSNTWCVSQDLPKLFTQQDNRLVLTVPSNVPAESLQQWKAYFDDENPTVKYTVESL